MTRYLLAYGAALIAFVLMDASWLTVMGSKFYKPVLGDMMLDKVRLVPAACFYLVYGLGIVVLAVRPALKSGSWAEAAVIGAVLGLVAYGTYDFTNAAILKSWSWTITCSDIAWGMVASSAGAVVGFLAASKVAA